MWTLEAEFDPSFAEFEATLDAASQLDLPQFALQRLKLLIVGIGEFIVYGDTRTTPGTDKIYLPLRLEFSDADALLFAAIRTRNIDSIRHLVLSLSPGTESHSSEPDKR